MRLELFAGLVLSSTVTTAASPAVALAAPLSLMVGVTVPMLSTGFGDQVDVYLQGSSDAENWANITSASFSSRGYGTVGPATNVTARFVRLRCVYTPGIGDGCILSATLQVEGPTGASASPAPPAPPT